MSIPTHIIGGHRVSDRVLDAVRDASRHTGADFNYMLAKAAQESGFRADAEATTSSATGLYQFIDSTWLGMIKEHGAQYGLDRQAAAIERTEGGGYRVADPNVRRAILDLRFDPHVNALMAGEFAKSNEEHLRQTVGGHVGATELYMAHFLGPAGASRFLNAMHDDPGQTAADLFPAAAAANRAVFYDQGRARSLKEVHEWMGDKMASGTGLADAAGGGIPAYLQAFPTEHQTGFPLAGADGATFLPVSPVGPGNPFGNGGAGDGNRQALSLWTVLTLSSLSVPGEDGQDGVPGGREAQAAPLMPTA